MHPASPSARFDASGTHRPPPLGVVALAAALAAAIAVSALGAPAGASLASVGRWSSSRSAGGAVVSTGAALRHLAGPVARAGRVLPKKGIIPPKNPPKNLPPKPDFYASCAGGTLDNSVGCNSQALKAINQARGTEPVGPISVSMAKFLKLSEADQLFVIANLERVSRGEPPMAALTKQLDKVALAGAQANADPDFSGSTLTGGASVHEWGSNWAGGTESALGSDDGWMYDDGPGGFNGDCTPTNMSGCWGHRDNILGLYPQYLQGCPSGQSHLVMGAGYARTSSAYVTSFTQIFVAACGAKPTDEVFTWAQAKAAISAKPKPPTVGIASSADGKGYLLVSSAGKVTAVGDAKSAGDLSAKSLPAPIVAIAQSEVEGSYWLVGSNGAVYPFGHAPSYGDLRAKHLAEPIVGIAVDPSTGGYWLVSLKGAVYGFHAPVHGSLAGKKLPAPVVAIVADPVAAGYWLVGSDGRVYPFGAAKSHGSEAGKRLAAPVVAAEATKDGLGYWLAGSKGAVYHFGDAVYRGSEAGKHLPAAVTGFAANPASTGYWLVGGSGAVYRFNVP